MAVAQSTSQVTEAIGAQFVAGSAASWFTGQIAEVRVYNRALTDNEVWELYAPQTRWDLYWQPSRRVYVQAPASFDATQFPHIPLDNPYIVPTRMVPSGRVS